jgi:hypothetical protein
MGRHALYELGGVKMTELITNTTRENKIRKLNKKRYKFQATPVQHFSTPIVGSPIAIIGY